jgi:TolB-like protein
MTEQRRLAAIVSADVAGYSRLMGQDESGTLAALKALRQEVVDPAITRHGGRIVKTTGDGLLLEFPSVVNAVRCAVEVQTAMADSSGEDRRIAFRVGINIGDIIVDGDDIFGDGVNIAARLQEQAAPGGICISGRVHEDVRDRLDAIFHDGGPQTLKNIARAVQVWHWRTGTVTSRPAPTPTALQLPDKPSIAVLPFQNLSGDPEQEYFADGIVEDIIGALSRFKSLFVIARNSSFAYKGKTVDIKQVGHELGVRYVLEGSLRKAGNRVRISGQLIDSETGAHLWADRFDGALEDVFSLQDAVTEKVVGALAPSVERAEMERAKRKPTANLDSYDCYLRGLAVSQVAPTTENFDEATSLFRRALVLDPTNARALGMLLALYVNRRGFGMPSGPGIEREELVRLVRLTVRLGSEDAAALGNAAIAIAYVLRDLVFAQEQMARALTLNPNLASAWANSGWINVWSGRPAEAVEHISRSIRLDPMSTRPYTRSGLAHAYFFLDRHDDALQVSEGLLRSYPNFFPGLRVGAASAAFAGKTDLAQELVARLRQVDPAIRVSCLQDYLGPYQSAVLDKFKQGLRLAGLPE